MSNEFNFSQEQLILSHKLSDKIITRINATPNKTIKFSQYMDMALYDGQYGYYSNNLYKFGSLGDFITAPSVSALFGYSISRQVLELFEHGVTNNILEFGAGNGNLMLDILAKCAHKLDKYYIIELSANLQKIQQDQLMKYYSHLKDKVVWLQALPEKFDGIILANEVLDAQSVEIITWQGQEIYYKEVSYSASKGFHYVPTNKLDSQFNSLISTLMDQADGYTSELHIANQYFINTLANFLNSGVIILIDYGYPQSEYYTSSRSQGTLRGFIHHRVVDHVLQYPGLMDITSCVNWSLIARTGISANLDLIGYTTQANFLINCGILDELEVLVKSDLEPTQQLKLSQQVNTLTSPSEMGQRFKVMAFSKNLDFYDFIGFCYKEQSYLL